MKLSRIDRIQRTFDVASLFPQLSAGSVTAVQFALLPPRSESPVTGTVWSSPITVISGSVTVLLAGPEADATGALVVPATADLWAMATNSPETEAVKIPDRITVAGSSPLPALPSLYVASVNGKTGAAVLAASDVGADATGAATAAQAAAIAAAASDATTKANAAQALAVQRGNHTGTQTADTLTDGTTNKAFLATERTKLTGIATAATANSPDATLLARANHTGTQAASTVTGLATVATSGAYADLSGQPTIPPTPPALLSANYYFPYSQGATSTSAALGTGTFRACPIIVARSTSLVRIGAEVTVVGDVGSKVRLGIYGDTGSGYPGTLVIDAGQIAGDSATVQELTISTTLAAGIYWLGAVVQSVTTTQPTLRTTNSFHPSIFVPLGGTIPAAGSVAVGVSTSGISAALPGTFPAGGGGAGVAARLFVKTA